MKMKDYLGKKSVSYLKKRFNEFLEAEAGFIIIGNHDTRRITDAYKDICGQCVLDDVVSTLKDANEERLLASHRDDPKHKHN